MNIKEGLKFILSHFEYPEHYFPRTISTKMTENRQVEVFSKDEALEFFKKSEYVDCRISAFGRFEQEKVMPNLIFVDLDNRDALNEVRCLFHKIINGLPTILDTGNGYAILQPVEMKSMEFLEYEGKYGEEIAKLFLQWVERYLTNYKCDSGNHPSLRNTMIRIPGSFNSKVLDREESLNKSKVNVVYGWNKKRVKVYGLPFKKYVNKIIQEKKKRAKINKKINLINFQWIEKLFQHKLEDGRERLLFDITRYLINMKGMTIEEAVNKIHSWLNCRYYPKSLIQTKCKVALKDGKYPKKLSTIKIGDLDLYESLPLEIKQGIKN